MGWQEECCAYDNRRLSRKYAMWALGAMFLAMLFYFFLVFSPVETLVFDESEYSALPYLFPIVLLYYGVGTAGFLTVSVVITYLLIREGKSSRTLIPVMIAMILLYNAGSFCVFYPEFTRHGDFSIFIRAYILWSILPSVLFLLLQIIAYMLTCLLKTGAASAHSGVEKEPKR